MIRLIFAPTTSSNILLLVTIPLHGFVSVMGKEMGKFKVYWFSVIGGQVKTTKKRVATFRLLPLFLE